MDVAFNISELALFVIMGFGAVIVMAVVITRLLLGD